MTLNTATYITVEGRYKTYTLNLTRGLYYISVLGDVEATINGTLVSNSISYYVDAEEGEVVTVRVTFINFTGTTATATATVVTDVMNVGLETSVALEANSSKVYGIDLERGLYTLTLSASENIEVRLDGVVIASENGIYTLNIAVSGGHTLTFVNNGTSEVTFNATVNTANMLALDVDNNVTIEAGMHSSTYYIDLTAGNYGILLTLSDGTSIQVTVNGEVVVAYGATDGSFTITADNAGYVQITFTTESDAAVAFTALIYRA